jgi:hypothetical protein
LLRMIWRFAHLRPCESLGKSKTAAESREAVFPRRTEALPLAALSMLGARSRLAGSKETRCEPHFFGSFHTSCLLHRMGPTGALGCDSGHAFR